MTDGRSEWLILKALRWTMFGLLVVLLSVMSGVVGFTIGDGGEDGRGTGSTSPAQGEADFGILDEIYDIIGEDFVAQDSVDPEMLRQGAIDGALSALDDPHTIYIDPETYSLGIDIVTGQFEGIGARVEQDPVSGEIVIVAPFRDSPADKAGIRAGDVILTVDGESTAGWSVGQAVRVIRGPQGTEVTLGVLHENGESEDITITRGVITVPTVFSHEVEDADGIPASDIAYVELQQMTEESVSDLADMLTDIEEKGYRGLILDLRRNPGGGLSATVEIADLFLDSGVILIQVDKDGNETVEHADGGDEGEEMPLVLLIGSGSASGAEVLAAAVRDNDRAVLIGSTTFGKGSVNHLRELSDGGALYITIARWLTPGGEQIEAIGLAPDIEVLPTDEDIELGRDVQLFAAIDYLREAIQAAVP
ncbi:MAG: S41 family peptidase [Dehalococcoidia bacterium]|nr:MAG: S41 family peptidase [Dehalococcoidia bacterium]